MEDNEKVINEIVEKIKLLSLLDINNLVKLLEKEFGVSLGNMNLGQGSNNSNEEKKEDQEPSEVNIILEQPGESKIAVIKIIKEITGLGLMESKKLCDTPNSVIKESVAIEKAKE